MKNIYLALFIAAITLTIYGCRKVTSNDENAYSVNELSEEQLQIFEQIGVDTITKFEDALLPDKTNIKSWLQRNAPALVSQNCNSTVLQPSSFVAANQANLLVAMMTQAAFNITTRSSFPNGQNGLAYVYGSYQYAQPATGIAGCSTIFGHGATCTEPLYGLDAAGLIFEIAQCAQLNLACGSIANYSQVNTWNAAFRNSPLYQSVSLADFGALPISLIQAGDIIVVSGLHIGFVISNGSGLLICNSIGSSSYTCALNKNIVHGPVNNPLNASWLNTLFGNTYHILRAGCGCGNVADIDGNVYTTVKIGTQCWMQQNLKTTRYRNGAPITEIEDSAAWANIFNNSLTTPAWCYYESNSANNAIYGKLYNEYAVNDPRNIAPVGWHVPSDSEVTLLINYLGGAEFAGGALKSTSGLWSAPNTAATNSSGFTGLPGGYCYHIGGFSPTGHFANFWCSTPNGSTTPSLFYLYYIYPNAIQDSGSATGGFSCRCIKDN